jgi:hypothetical protein
MSSACTMNQIIEREIALRMNRQGMTRERAERDVARGLLAANLGWALIIFERFGIT